MKRACLSNLPRRRGVKSDRAIVLGDRAIVLGALPLAIARRRGVGIEARARGGVIGVAQVTRLRQASKSEFDPSLCV
jgi:hypothetical protein